MINLALGIILRREDDGTHHAHFASNIYRLIQSKPHPWHGAGRLDLGSQGQLLLVSFHKNASQIVVSHPQGDATELLLLTVAHGTLQLQGRSRRTASFTTCLRALPLQPDTFVSGELSLTPSDTFLHLLGSAAASTTHMGPWRSIAWGSPEEAASFT